MAERRIINGYIVERGDDGVIRTIGPANQPAQPPVDPTFQYKGSQAAADLQGRQVTTQGNALDNQITAATLPSVVRKTGAEATGAELDNRTRGLPEGYQWGPDGRTAQPIPGYSRQGLSPEIRKGAIDAFNDARAIDGIVADLRAQYQAGPGSTKGIAGLRDFLPTDANKVFNDTGQRARGYVKRSLGFTGGEGNTVAESSALYDPYLPKAGDRDAQIESKINALEKLGLQARQKAANVLGGEPDERGNVIPFGAAATSGAGGPGAGGPGSVWQQTYIQGGGGSPGAAGQGATTQQVPLPPQVQQELQAYIQQQGPNLEPNKLRSFIDGLYTKYGFAPNAASGQWSQNAARAARQGGTINTNVPGPTAPLTGVDKIRNDIISSPVGTGAANFADAGSLGAVSLLTGDALGAANEENPTAALLGQIGGSVLGTEGLGMLGRSTVGRALPSALGGGERAALARGVGTDALYSGVYGGAQGNDPLESAAFGTGGSLLGRGVGRVAGDVLSGLDSPTIARLRAQGVTPTIGQIARGRAIDRGGRSALAGLEDVISNQAGAGSLVNSARARALDDANLAALNTASGGRPITATGVQGLDQLADASTAAYGDALNGVSLTPDAQYAADIAAARSRGAQVDAGRARGDFGLIDNQQLSPILGAGPDISGRQMQDALRLLSGQSRAYRRAASGAAPDPSATMVSDALDQAGDAFTDLAARQAPATLPQLRQANSIYRNLNVLDDAAERAMGEGGVFTGAQLGQAIKKNTGMFGRRGLRSASDSPLYQLQQDMQAVLPNKVPPTGVNTAPALALVGAGAGAAGYGTDNDYLKAGGLAALLATPYTRIGQAAAARALLDRPAAVQTLGELLRANSRRVGAAAIPLALPIAGQ